MLLCNDGVDLWSGYLQLGKLNKFTFVTPAASNTINTFLYRHHSEQSVSLPLSQVRLCLHGHQQGSRAQTPTSEAGLHHGRWLREVHPFPELHTERVHPFRQADALPLSELSVRSRGIESDDSAQVQTHGRGAAATAAMILASASGRV